MDVYGLRRVIGRTEIIPHHTCQSCATPKKKKKKKKKKVGGGGRGMGGGLGLFFGWLLNVPAIG